MHQQMQMLVTEEAGKGGLYGNSRFFLLNFSVNLQLL